MKSLSYSFLFLILLIFIVIFSTVSLSCTSYQPYSDELMFSGMYPYSNEGFRNNQYSSYPKNSDIDNVNKSEVDLATTCHKVAGFDGILCSPDSTLIRNDIFSEAKGSLNCKSYGYSNSRGFLCMDADQVRLLTTRGGNA